MSRKQGGTILHDELAELPLFEMVMEAQTGCGLAMRQGNLFVGTVPAIFVVALGPVGQLVEETVHEWQQQAEKALAAAREQQSAAQKETS